MAKEFIVVENGQRIVDRVDSKQEAEDRATELSNENKRASYEFGKLDKRLFHTVGNVDYTPGEEIY